MLNPVAMKLKEQLAATELALQDLLQGFTEGHRTVIEKREQIAFIKKELAAAEEKIIGRETISLNPLRQNLTQQLADAQAHLATLTSEGQIVAKQVDQVSATLPGMREKKVKIDERKPHRRSPQRRFYALWEKSWRKGGLLPAWVRNNWLTLR